MNQSRSYISVIVVILAVGLVFGLVWGNYQLAKRDVTREGFLIQWLSIRSLVVDGNSPYSDQVTSTIVKTIRYENSFAKGNPPRYLSPLYSGIVIFPFTLIGDITIAQAIWSSALLLAIFITLLVSAKLNNWKSRWYIFLLISLFILFSYHTVIPWLDGGLPTWVSLFLISSFLAIRNNKYELAGISLALATIQPQMTILLIIFVLFWVAAQRKWMMIFWFFVTLIILSIIGLLLVPDWLMQYLRLLYNYPENFPPGNLGMLFGNLWPGVGKQLSWLFSGILAIVLIIEWRLALHKDFRWFIWVACLTMVVSQWIGIPTIPGHFIQLILPIILISAMLSERWPRGGPWLAVFITAILFVWEWALYYINITGTQPSNQLNLIIPLPLILLLGLYWTRWWAIKPKRLMIEELKLGEIY